MNKYGLGYWWNDESPWFINGSDSYYNTLCLNQDSVYITTNDTTASDIVKWIVDIVYKDRRALCAFRIYDDYNKFFGESGNWMCYGWFQDRSTKVVIAVNHWTANMKILTLSDKYNFVIRGVQLVS